MTRDSTSGRTLPPSSSNSLRPRSLRGRGCCAFLPPPSSEPSFPRSRLPMSTATQRARSGLSRRSRASSSAASSTSTCRHWTVSRTWRGASRGGAMCELEEIALQTKDEVGIRLWHSKSASGTPVLLLHGASACHETFRVVPEADPLDTSTSPPRSLMDWLERQGFDPWLVDWRGSGLVVDAVKDQDVLRDCFDFDRAAQCDVPAALEEITKRTNHK